MVGAVEVGGDELFRTQEGGACLCVCVCVLLFFVGGVGGCVRAVMRCAGVGRVLLRTLSILLPLLLLRL